MRICVIVRMVGTSVYTSVIVCPACSSSDKLFFRMNHARSCEDFG